VDKEALEEVAKTRFEIVFLWWKILPGISGLGPWTEFKAIELPSGSDDYQKWEEYIMDKAMF